MDDALIALVLQGMGITPSDPNYATYASALRSRAQAENDVQGRWFDEDIRRFDRGDSTTRYGIDQRYKEAQQSLQNQRKDIDNRYEIAKAGVRNDEERTRLDRWKAEQDTRLREAEIAIRQGDLELGRGRLGLDTELGRGRLNLDRGAQGLDLLDRDIQLRQTPRSWAALADWEAGVSANADAPVFLRSLLENSTGGPGSPTAAPSMVARQGLPEQNSLAATLAGLGVGQAGADQTNAMMSGAGTGDAATTGAGAKPEETPQMTAIKAMLGKHQFSDTEGWDPKDSAMLRSIATLAAQGSHKSANRYAMQDEDDKDLIRGGLARLGINPERWDRNVERQRWGGGAHSGLAV